MLSSLGTFTGFLTPSYRKLTATEPTMRRPATHSTRFQSVQAWTHREAVRDELRDRLIATPTACRPDIRGAIAAHNRLRPPSRSHVIAAHREGLRTSAGLPGRDAGTPPLGTAEPGSGTPIVHVLTGHIKDATKLEDPYANYEISTVDLMNVFYKIDTRQTGCFTLHEFEAAMLDLGYTPEQIAKIFAALDTKDDQMISMDEWTSDRNAQVAKLLTYKFLRSEAMGRNPQCMTRPKTTLTDQKFAMEMTLAKLGVTAKTNFISIKQMFDSIDADGSGSVDSDELANTVEMILKQKLSKGVREDMMRKFDANGDGTVDPKEFMDKLLANPMSALYGYLPGSVVLA